MTTIVAPSRRRRRPHPAAPSSRASPGTRGMVASERCGTMSGVKGNVAEGSGRPQWRHVSAISFSDVNDDDDDEHDDNDEDNSRLCSYLWLFSPCTCVHGTCVTDVVCIASRRVASWAFALWLKRRYIAVRTFANVDKLTFHPSRHLARTKTPLASSYINLEDRIRSVLS